MNENELKNNIDTENNNQSENASDVADVVVSDDSVAEPADIAVKPSDVATEPVTDSGRSRNKREFKKNKRSPRRKERVRSEFDQKIIDIRRVTRVSKGGRRFSFSVALVIGNRKGKIGVGIGKAGDTALAIEKASKDAKKNSIVVKTTKNMSIPHEVSAKFNSARVMIMPAPGRGIIAGSALRDIIELGGLKDINAKILSGSKNKLNIAKATVDAFSQLENTVRGEVAVNEKRIMDNKKASTDRKSAKSKK